MSLNCDENDVSAIESAKVNLITNFNSIPCQLSGRIEKRKKVREEQQKVRSEREKARAEAAAAERQRRDEEEKAKAVEEDQKKKTALAAMACLGSSSRTQRTRVSLNTN